MLFKYRAVHDALRVLQGGALYWSPPSKFADHEDCKWNPFESLLNQDFEVVHRKVLRELLTGPIDWSRVRDPAFRKLTGQERVRIASIPLSRRESEIERAVEDLASTLEVTKSLSRERIASITTRLRVLCLCETPASDRMWHEYAAGGSGCVLGFETRRLEEAWLVPVGRVQYMEDFPRFVDPERWSWDVFYDGPGVSEEEVARIALEWPLIKRTHWSHEQEWRFVSLNDRGDEDRVTPLPFPRDSLRVIYTGPSIAAADLAQLEQSAPQAKIVPSKQASE